MSSKLRLTAIALALASLLFGGEDRYQTRKPNQLVTVQIPDSLKVGAHSVVLFESINYQIKDIKHARKSVQRAVTVLDKEGIDSGHKYLFHNKFTKLRKIKVRVLDANGRVVKKIKRIEMVDIAAYSGSLFDDNRVRIIRPFHSTYPYTVLYEYEMDYSSLMHIGGWAPFEVEHQSIVEAHLRIEITGDIPFRYSSTNTTIEPTVESTSRRQSFTWFHPASRALEIESYGPAFQDQVPRINLVFEQFQVEKYLGSLSSWNEFGEWYNMLSEGRSEISDENKKRIDKVLIDATSREDTVKSLYEFMQSTTRYVSIQLGIGGWQTFPASTVFETGYGDCKALTNYLFSMLKSVGIPSFPVLIGAGGKRAELDVGFPANMFNHVILCVPTGRDTTWLECTSQTSPYNFLSSFTEDRYGLLVKPGGSELVRTPRGTFHSNSQIRRGEIEIDPQGNLSVNIETVFTGNQQSRVRGSLRYKAEKDRRRIIVSDIIAPATQLTEFDFSDLNNISDTLQLSMSMVLPGYLSRAGDMLFYKLNIFNPRIPTLPKNQDRQHPFRIPYPYRDYDKIKIVLPHGYRIKSLPKPVEFRTDFAQFSASVESVSDREIVYLREMIFFEKSVDASKYGDLREFYTKVVNADRASLILEMVVN